MCLFCIKRKPHFFMWRDWLRIILKSFSSTLKKWRNGPTSGAEQNPQPSEISSCSLGRPTFPAFQMKCFRFDYLRLDPSLLLSSTTSINLADVRPESYRFLWPRNHLDGGYTLCFHCSEIILAFKNGFLYSPFWKKTTTLIQGDITVEGKLNKGLPAPKPMKS